MSEFIAGPNFSGRSAALMARLREIAPAFFIGPYAEAALSGLSSTVTDEIDIYRASKPVRSAFTPLDFAAYVAVICLRLFVIAFAIEAAFLHFAGWTPLRFVGGLTAPRLAKKLLVLTLSLIETILQAVDRARTALIGAGIITRKQSWRNLRHGWILVQTVWLTVVTIAIGRTRDKWPVEDTLGRLDGVLAASAAPRLSAADLGWMALAVAGAAIALGMRW